MALRMFALQSVGGEPGMLGELAKLKLQPQKLFAKLNSTSMYLCSATDPVTANRESLMNPGYRTLLRGESVRSIVGELDCMFVSSAISSVKIFTSSVSMLAPAGYQNPEQTPVDPCVGHGAGIAQARGIVGR